jgi:hypothetical protein
MTNWIDVNDRLPDTNRQVLVWTVFGFGLDQWDEINEAPVSFSSQTICVGEGWQDHDFDQVTHWAEITPPTERAEG